MSKKCFLAGALILPLISLSCATQTKYNPFKIEQGEFFSNTKNIGLLPVFVPTDIINDSDSVKANFESLITAKLREAGFSVVPSKEYSAIWKQMTEQVGGYFDPISGKRDEAKFNTVREHAFRELSTKFNVDVLLFPRIEIVKAAWSRGAANWDGATEQIRSTGDLFAEALIGTRKWGTLPALTLRVYIEDLNGRSLYVNAHGLQVLSKESGGQFSNIPRSELFPQERNIAAINAVLEPLVNRSKATETPQAKP
jgi:hypothetical protein